MIEVLVPSFTFAATANAVSLCGAIPIFVDINPQTFNMDVNATESAIGKNTAGILPVHLYGHPADMPAFSKLAAQHGLHLFEDAAQAHLASIAGSPVGSFGTGIFSFYPTKNMTAGEGGMILGPEDPTKVDFSAPSPGQSVGGRRFPGARGYGRVHERFPHLAK